MNLKATSSVGTTTLTNLQKKNRFEEVRLSCLKYLFGKMTICAGLPQYFWPNYYYYCFSQPSINDEKEIITIEMFFTIRKKCLLYVS